MELLTKYLRNRRCVLWVCIGLGSTLLLTLFLVLLLWGISAESPQETTLATTDAPTTEYTPPQPNVFAADDFVMVDGYMTCTTAPYELGIDVCSYQGQIDWQQVAQTDIRFVMIRVGGRGWGPEGRLYVDEFAQINYEGAKAAGLKVGVYFFSQALNTDEAREEAQLLLDTIAGWQLDMPVVYDWEQIPAWTDPESRTAEADKRTVTDCTVTFCEAVARAGYTPMLYTNTRQYENLLFPDEVKGYSVWAAIYNDEMTFPHHINMWQYSNTGSVPGIEGDVDMNLYFPVNEVS